MTHALVGFLTELNWCKCQPQNIYTFPLMVRYWNLNFVEQFTSFSISLECVGVLLLLITVTIYVMQKRLFIIINQIWIYSWHNYKFTDFCIKSGICIYVHMYIYFYCWVQAQCIKCTADASLAQIMDSD